MTPDDARRLAKLKRLYQRWEKGQHMSGSEDSRWRQEREYWLAAREEIPWLLAQLEQAQQRVEALQRSFESWRRLRDEAADGCDKAEARVAQLEKCLALCAVPYEGILANAESRRWVAPKIWTAMQNAVLGARAALGSAD